MRPIGVITCPLWEDADGSRRPGMAPESDPPPVVDWVNVLVLELYGEEYRLLLTKEATGG